jgi:hypothetical protein
MARRKIDRLTMKYFGDQFVDEMIDERMVAAGRRDEIAAIPWQDRNYAGTNTRLNTPYGLLEVCRSIGPSWYAQREGANLVHARSPREALFTTATAAKAAGFIHVSDGFGGAVPDQDGLWWDIKRPATRRVVAPPPVDLPIDPSTQDDHEWGRQRLDCLLKQSGVVGSAPDENLVIHLEGAARRWHLPPPMWSTRAHGCYGLDTPYGTLVVRRLIGWTVERDGAPIVWFSRRDRVIFDRLEHAKTSALIHAADYGYNRFVDGTLWGERPDNQVEALHTSTSDAGGCRVVVS